jgi:hypothetical protein
MMGLIMTFVIILVFIFFIACTVGITLFWSLIYKYDISSVVCFISRFHIMCLFWASLSDMRNKYISIELIFSLVIFTFASLGLLYSPYWLVLGYILHGV